MRDQPCAMNYENCFSANHFSSESRRPTIKHASLMILLLLSTRAAPPEAASPKDEGSLNVGAEERTLACQLR